MRWEERLPVYDDSYFEGEVRDGFYIEGRMKRVWAAQIKVLKVIEELCERHGLRYFADWGTLLGAIRHQGYIPWDDDLDILMLREDYEKLIEAAQSELPEGYELFCVHTNTDTGYRQPFARITNGRMLRYDRRHLEEWYGCPYVVGVDIFQRDYLSRNREEEEMREQIMRVVIAARGACCEGTPEAEELLRMTEEYCNVTLDRTAPLEPQLRLLIDRLAQIYPPEASDEVALLTSYVLNGRTKSAKSCFDRQIWVPFETTTIPIPSDADACLRPIYGEDYMTPRIVLEHEYPFMEVQERAYINSIMIWREKNSAGVERIGFSEDYFAGEERCGFFVESAMKHVWAAQLELLKIIEEICEKHGLRYFADWGTLLGAVRHQGYIPWDDDIDITMLREDYQRFLEVAQEELPGGCELLSVYTDEHYAQSFARVINGRSVRYDRQHLERWHGCPYKIGIDIFPRDYLSRDQEQERGREGLLRLVMAARDAVRENAADREELLAMVERYCKVQLKRTMSLERQLLIVFDRLCGMFSGEQSDEVTDLYHYLVGSAGACPKEWYEKQDWLAFENTKIAAPIQTAGCLEALFGKEYLTPRIWHSHDYPFYERQQQNYEEWRRLSDLLLEDVHARIEQGSWEEACDAAHEYNESGMWSEGMQQLRVLCDIYEKEFADEVEHGFFDGLYGEGGWQRIEEKYRWLCGQLRCISEGEPEGSYEELAQAVRSGTISYDAVILTILYEADNRLACVTKICEYYQESGQERYAKRMKGICTSLAGFLKKTEKKYAAVS